MLSWSQFCKEPLPERNFTFWEWFYAVMKLTREHLRGPWIDGWVYSSFVQARHGQCLITLVSHPSTSRQVVYISFVLNMNSPPQKNRAYLEQFWHLKSNVASAWAEHTESNLCCLRSAVCNIFGSHKQGWQYVCNVTLWHIYLTIVALEMWQRMYCTSELHISQSVMQEYLKLPWRCTSGFPMLLSYEVLLNLCVIHLVPPRLSEQPHTIFHQ